MYVLCFLKQDSCIWLYYITLLVGFSCFTCRTSNFRKGGSWVHLQSYHGHHIGGVCFCGKFLDHIFKFISGGYGLRNSSHKQFLVPPFYHVKRYNLLLVVGAVALIWRRGQHFQGVFQVCLVEPFMKKWHVKFQRSVRSFELTLNQPVQPTLPFAFLVLEQRSQCCQCSVSDQATDTQLTLVQMERPNHLVRLLVLKKLIQVMELILTCAKMVSQVASVTEIKSISCCSILQLSGFLVQYNTVKRFSNIKLVTQTSFCSCRCMCQI